MYPITTPRSLRLIPALLLPLLLATAQAEAPVARAGGVSGIVSVQRTDGSISVLAQGSALTTGDVVKTERESYARLSFTDGSELALRPDSQIRIQNYRYEEAQPGNDSLVLQFIKGGFRALTGLIGKRGNKDAYRIAAPTMTIGIRGTDYVARLCDDSCKTEQARQAGRKAPGLEIAARIGQMQGSGTITANTGKVRSLENGVPLYAGDLVRTDDNSYSVLVFSDNTRVTLQKDSAFLVSRYHYDAKSPEAGNVFLEMVRGGARFVTGLIGKAKPKSFHVNTVTATIGVRGTGFDVFCAPKGSGEGAAEGGSPPAAQCNEAVYQYTWDGQTELSAAGTTTQLAAGNAGLVTEPGKAPRNLAEVPLFMRNNDAPRPDLVPVDMGKLFGASEDTAEPGLYVSVLDGRVVLTQGTELRELRQGEAGYAAGSGPVELLAAPPSFLAKDPYLRSMKFDPLSCLAQ